MGLFARQTIFHPKPYEEICRVQDKTQLIINASHRQGELFIINSLA